jgi:hypothetical protein
MRVIDALGRSGSAAEPGKSGWPDRAVVRLIDATHRADGTCDKRVLPRGLEFMNVVCCVHPLGAWSLTGPFASASGSLIASVITAAAVWLRLLGIRASEAAETPLLGWLLPQWAAMLPPRHAHTRSFGRSLIDQAPTLLRTPPPSARGWQDSLSVRPQCARAESSAIAAAAVAEDRDTLPPLPARNPLVLAQPLSDATGPSGRTLVLRAE